MQRCQHLLAVTTAELERPPRTPEGCEECLASGERWVHRRMCVTCGHVGCCDSSTGKHATQHYQTTGHAVMRSIERGEPWMWCYADSQKKALP